jgi:NADH:ubiquinone oxidoreductase subunit 2 (subunit N)
MHISKRFKSYAFLVTAVVTAVAVLFYVRARCDMWVLESAEEGSAEEIRSIVRAVNVWLYALVFSGISVLAVLALPAHDRHGENG